MAINLGKCSECNTYICDGDEVCHRCGKAVEYRKSDDAPYVCDCEYPKPQPITSGCPYEKDIPKYYDEPTERTLEYNTLLGLICHFGQLSSAYPDKQHILLGQNTIISSSQYKDLAQAIKEFIAGRIEAIMDIKSVGYNEWIKKADVKRALGVE
jgi:hypothetical protein